MQVSKKNLTDKFYVWNAKKYAFYLLNIAIAIFCKYRIDISSKLKKMISKQHYTWHTVSQKVTITSAKVDQISYFSQIQKRSAEEEAGIKTTIPPYLNY